MIKKVVTLYDGAVKAISENGDAILVHPYDRGVIEVDVTNVGGTSPTLVVAIETAWDSAGPWFHNTIVVDKDRQGDLVRTTAPVDEAKITTVSKHIAWLERLSRYIRPVLTIGGSGGQTFTLSARVTLYG